MLCNIQWKLATIPYTNGLYHITAAGEPLTINYASIVMVKMTISEAHWKLSHITPVAIKYAITKGHITSIQIDPELKTKFCKACSKAKVAQQPFPKELETHASKYRVCVHWDLWGPAAVQSISRNWNVAACIDDMTHETMLYFQVKKSQTIEFCKHNKVPIETQTSNHIKVSHSD